MLIKDFSLEKIRKRYALDKKNEFVMRIREGKNNEKSEDALDIVYYNGRKILTIENGKSNIQIKIFDNIFKLNKANMIKAFELKTDIVTATINLRKSIENYYKFELNKLILKPSRIINQKKELTISILKNLREELLEYINSGVISDFIPEHVYNELLKESYEINIEKDNLGVEESVKIEYIFLKNCLFKEKSEFAYANGKNGLAKPEVDMDIKDILEKERKFISKNELEKFELALKNAVDNYNKNTKFDMEKIYQHQFMVRDISYKCDEFKNMYKFEMEYPINEGVKNEKGRIDNVFVKIDKDKNTAEVYFIELKVDEKVIGGTNGIHKHLIDIEKIYNENRLENFINTLEERVNYRIKELLNEEEMANFKPIEIKRDIIHFWVVIAISEKNGTYIDNAKKVQVMMKNLEDEEYIKIEKSRSKKIALPNESKVISKHIVDLNNKKCEIKILYDLWKEEKENNYNISENRFFQNIEEYIKTLETNKRGV